MRRLACPLVLAALLQLPGPDLAAQYRWVERDPLPEAGPWAYDPIRGRAVSFNNRETFEWDGAEFVRRAPTFSPNSLAGHALAYDPSSNRTVAAGAGTYLWDGETWRRATGSTPFSRGGVAMTHHGPSGRLVLFGGQDFGVHGDTWAFDGASWSQLPSASGPPARYDHSMVYDSARGVVVMFGGSPNGPGWHNVRLGDIRKLAKEIKTDHELALALWETENVDARLLAILLIRPKSLSSSEIDRMVRAAKFTQSADWLNAHVVKKHPDRETLRQKWMTAKDAMAARTGWNLTAERVAKGPAGLDLPALLDRIESEMGTAAPQTQWTMNNCLANIGIHHPDHRERALAIGEKLGVYRDYPVSKGCTSPFAPIWINEMVSRQG